ncbi:hypothetical protein M426DRAFT_11955 [Hypoxylon sp. CI-4A]|nr:hypothetical protein M426DRAFT_11955 [Hypoxylon sp. CI-4A]
MASWRLSNVLNANAPDAPDTPDAMSSTDASDDESDVDSAISLGEDPQVLQNLVFALLCRVHADELGNGNQAAITAITEITTMLDALEHAMEHDFSAIQRSMVSMQLVMPTHQDWQGIRDIISGFRRFLRREFLPRLRAEKADEEMREAQEALRLTKQRAKYTQALIMAFVACAPVTMLGAWVYVMRLFH